MGDKAHSAIVKVLALLLGLWGFVTFVNGFGADGFFSKLWWLAVGLFMIGTAVGFWRFRGWAFLVVSVGLLAAFFITQIHFLLAIDKRDEVFKRGLIFVAVIVLIGYVGRWSLERRFRPYA